MRFDLALAASEARYDYITILFSLLLNVLTWHNFGCVIGIQAVLGSAESGPVSRGESQKAG